MRMLVIRHGESEADITGVHEGRADFNLTEKGHKQAEAMAEWVSERYRIDRIYASTLRRAQQTAEHLSAHCGLPIGLEENLMEFNNGLIAGLTREDAASRYPEVKNLPVHKSVYEQESRLAFRFRADYMLSKILDENQDNDTVAVITHGGMAVQLYHSFLKLPLNQEILFQTGDTGIHEWIVRDNKRIVVMSNSMAHLRTCM